MFVGTPEQAKEITLLRAENTTVQFEGFSDRDKAAGLTNQFILVSLSELKEIVQRERHGAALRITDLWYFELVGMQVIDAESQKALGTISHVEDAGLNTIVSIEPESVSELKSTLDIPLDYPHWHAPDLAANQIGLSEWRIFTDPGT